jgi:hypothetical protein
MPDQIFLNKISPNPSLQKRGKVPLFKGGFRGILNILYK